MEYKSRGPLVVYGFYEGMPRDLLWYKMWIIRTVTTGLFIVRLTDGRGCSSIGRRPDVSF